MVIGLTFRTLYHDFVLTLLNQSQIMLLYVCPVYAYSCFIALRDPTWYCFALHRLACVYNARKVIHWRLTSPFSKLVWVRRFKESFKILNVNICFLHLCLIILKNSSWWLCCQSWASIGGCGWGWGGGGIPSHFSPSVGVGFEVTNLVLKMFILHQRAPSRGP